ncbi:MAG: PucC family protein [Anaerolineae bacterium]|nr:PucC family protein [Anaerolineae bacterium]
MRLFLIAGGIFFSLWFFSLLGEEKRHSDNLRRDAGESPTSLRGDLALVWRSLPMRFFLFYLTLSMFFAFSQDPVLEPFAGDVFGMAASVTNRFAAYWGSMSIFASLLRFMVATEKRTLYASTLVTNWRCLSSL